MDGERKSEGDSSVDGLSAIVERFARVTASEPGDAERSLLLVEALTSTAMGAEGRSALLEHFARAQRGGDDAESTRQALTLLTLNALGAEGRSALLEQLGRTRTPAGDPAAGSMEPGTIVDERPGRYILKGVIGRGGQSVVHLAMDQSLGRPVAFKQPIGDPAPEPVTPGLSSREVRFVREARITAQLDHPGIAPVHEIGRRKDGSLYATQKLIRGRTLSAELSACSGPEARLALLPGLLGACQAVAFAHARGVIHRDLKPMNIMVGEMGEVVVLDWGLARARGEASGESPSHDAPVEAPLEPSHDPEETRAGAIIGTPHYMSPEQALGEVGSVDERSDVWGLGVILYELLTGVRPFQGESSQAVLKAVAAGSVAPVRRILPAAPVELAAVAERALSRDPARRYANAGELADELSRFLTGRLVAAHTYSTSDLVRRWLRRHAALVTATAVFLATLAVLSVIGVRRVVAERDRASREAQTTDRVATFLTKMFLVADPSEGRGATVTARELLDTAASEVATGLDTEPELQARLLDTMGRTYAGIGLLPDAHRMLQQAVDLRRRTLGPEHRDTLASVRALASLLDDEGHYPESEAMYRDVLEIQRRRLGADHPDVLATEGSLASVLFAEGRAAESEAVARGALERIRKLKGSDSRDALRLMNLIGISLIVQGNLPEAERVLEETLGIQRRVLGADHRSTMKTVLNLGGVLIEEHRPAEALRLYDELLPVQQRVLGPIHPDTLQTLHNKGVALAEAGRDADAVALMRELGVLQQKVFGPDHPETARTELQLGSSLSKLGRRAEAEPILRSAQERLARALGPKHSNVAEADVALARILATSGRSAEALDRLEHAIAADIPAGLRAGLATDPDLAALQGEPRFRALTAEGGKPPAAAK